MQRRQTGRQRVWWCLTAAQFCAALTRSLLKAGSVEAVGQLEELLETCVEMRRLWQGDVDSDETAETIFSWGANSGHFNHTS